MSRNVITIMKKEFARFFGDKRLLFTSILMPGIMIYVMYTFIGQGLMTQFTAQDDYVYRIHTVNLPESFSFLKEQDGISVEEDSSGDVEMVKAMLEEQQADLLLVFPEQFDEAVAGYDPASASGAAPDVEMYYNSVSTESQTAYSMVYEILDEYESSLANKFDVNADEGTDYDMATDKDSTAQIFSMMLPMLMMMFLFSGCMAVAPESIVGEKERGTIATLLVTPMRRSELAFGKIISLSVIGLLSGLSSFVGTMLSIPQLMGGAADGMSAAVYSVVDYVLLLFVILSTVLVVIGGISVLSGLAKSVKEAGTMVTPLMILVMLISITAMLGSGAPEEAYWYLIPFYNSVQCMNGIFSFTMIPVNFAVTIVSNVVYALLTVVALTRIFDSEKIMYN